LEQRDLQKALHAGARIFNLKVGGKDEKVLLKSVQYDPVQNTPLHVDFLKIDLTKEVEVDVDLTLKGRPTGVTEEGGHLVQYVKQVKVACLPLSIPDDITVEVSALKLRQGLHVRELPKLEGIRILNDLDLVLCIVEPPVEEAPAVVEVTAAPTPTEPEVIKKERKTEEETEETKEKEKEKK
jgi:large subunit ribosomal protein L25